MVWLSELLSDVERHDGTLTGVVSIQNQGRSLGVVRRVEGHIVSGDEPGGPRLVLLSAE